MDIQSKNPILVQMTRNGTVESFHRGSVCVLDREGNILFQMGDIREVVFPRSAIKFMQALPLLESGAADKYGFTQEELAVICASHNGEPEHVSAVASILAKTGISADHLGCGTHHPTHGESYASLLRAGQSPSDLHNNCSGKHSGFLALAAHIGAPLEGYLHPDHPVQVRVREALADLCEVSPDSFLLGTDGCSAPNFALPLAQLAAGFKNLVTGQAANAARTSACAKIVEAISAHPYMVAGTGRYCTELMQYTQGFVIGKLGAEGVYCAAVPSKGIGLAVKIDDGATGPQYNVTQYILERLGCIPEDAKPSLSKYLRTPLKNFKKTVTGYREIAPALEAAF